VAPRPAPLHDPRALLRALHGAAVQGAAPWPRTQAAVGAWCRTARLAPGTGVHLLALGKAAPAMAAGAAAAVDDVGAHVVGGLVVAGHPPGGGALPDPPLPTAVRRVTGDHPVPGPASLAAADALGEAVEAIPAGGVVVVLLSGGTTALCAAPVAALAQAVGDAGRAQAHVANLAETLLGAGLAIHEMNAIRRRVLRWGAGRLAVALAARGVRHQPVFAISDVIGDDPAVIGSGPCTPDPLDDTTLLALLDAHGIRPRLERVMALALGVEGASPPLAVPPRSHPAFAHAPYTLVARNADAVAALANAAAAAGCTVAPLTEGPLEGEAAPLGAQLVREALARARGRPADAAPLLLVGGGEPVVRLDALGGDDRAPTGVAPAMLPSEREADEPLRGGRMQALALAAALTLEAQATTGDPHAWQVTLLAAGTDGRDGPTDAAGAIVDAAVPALARRAGRRPERELDTGRSWFPLEAAGALLRTGPTGTNVMDVVAILVDGPEAVGGRAG
jgi:glycerate 2-kinase